jgi:thiol:disulfide interchange protein
MNSFLSQNGMMLLVFAVFLVPAIFSRRMERSDWLTLLAMPIITFFVAVLPGVIIYGFDKDAATYLLGVLVVVTVATLNYRFQPKPRDRETATTTSQAASSRPAEEG